MNWILFGFRGAGKTTLARSLSHPVFDTDEWVEKEARKTLAELSMPEFAAYEKKAVVAAAGCHDTVISVGGATLLDEENRELLHRCGTFIYLSVSKKLLKKRWKERPLRDRDFEEVFSERIPIYEAIAEITFSPEKENVNKLWEIINSADTFA